MSQQVGEQDPGLSFRVLCLSMGLIVLIVDVVIVSLLALMDDFQRSNAIVIVVIALTVNFGAGVCLAAVGNSDMQAAPRQVQGGG